MSNDATMMITRSGGVIDLMTPDLSEIHLDDIAWSLSRTGRWANQLPTFHSVAHHSVRVADTLLGRNGNKRLALLGLMHDAHEYLLSDIVNPFKRRLVNYGVWASRFQGAIYRRFSLDPVNAEYAAVQAVDEADAKQEAAQFMRPEQLRKYWPEAMFSAGEPIHPMTPDQAYKVFLERAKRYGIKDTKGSS